MSTDFYIHHFADAVEMPIPPVEAQMEIFEAGALTVGVEFRILTDELIATMGRTASAELGALDDVGVSIHVFVKSDDGNRERLRFDCFREAPHYHYLSWSELRNDHVFIDPAIHGDILAWVLDIIRTRLPQMLEKTGIANATEVVDQRRLEAILPRVTEAAYRARFHADRERITQAALADGAQLRIGEAGGRQ